MKPIIGCIMLGILWAGMCGYYATIESYGALLIWIFIPPIGWFIATVGGVLLLCTEYSNVLLGVFVAWVIYPAVAITLMGSDE